jgi:hypothetical protein
MGVSNDNVQKLIVDAKGVLARDGQFDASIRLERLRYRNTLVELSLLQCKGSLSDHRLEFMGQHNVFSVKFSQQGAVNDALWQGILSQTRFSDQRLGSWQHGQRTSLTLSEKSRHETALPCIVCIQRALRERRVGCFRQNLATTCDSQSHLHASLANYRDLQLAASGLNQCRHRLGRQTVADCLWSNLDQY